MPDITNPMKTKKVNIGSEAELKLTTIGDYWDEGTVSKITYFLHEHQDLFPTKFSDMKGIVGDLGVMKIPLKSNVKIVK